jgi:surface antigen
MAWDNPNSGRHGTIVPGPTYQHHGAKCREFTHMIYIDDRPQIARGVACRNLDGRWMLLCLSRPESFTPVVS